MLSQLRQGQRQLAPLGALAIDAFDMQQTRGMKLFEIFSKERRAERKAKLKDDMQRGYFDDFRDFRDSQGKVFHAPTRLIPAAAAPVFPQITPLTTDGTPLSFPFTGPTAPAASLVCIAFRAGAQEMIEAWAEPFSRAASLHNEQHTSSPDTIDDGIISTTNKKNSTHLALVELALIESVVMGVWPFRNILMKNGGASQRKYALDATYLYHFSRDTDSLRAALNMTNRLTGYVYLVDSLGRVRWRGSGNPSGAEIDMLLQFSQQLLKEEEGKSTAAVGDAVDPLLS